MKNEFLQKNTRTLLMSEENKKYIFFIYLPFLVEKNDHISS